MLPGAMEKQLQSDDAAKQLTLPATPPPVQFLDHSHYNQAGADQPLGPVPEEEESDWSEMGDEARQYVPIGHHDGAAILTWISGHRSHWVEGDTESESGGEEVIRQYPTRPLQIPHLQFTVHQETVPILMDDVSSTSFQKYHRDPAEDHHFPPPRKLGSPIRILSASMEEISGAGLKMQGHTTNCTEAAMDRHHPRGDVTESPEEEGQIVHSWREAQGHGTAGGGGGGVEPAASLRTLQEAERLLHRYISQSPPRVVEEVLNGERTKL